MNFLLLAVGHDSNVAYHGDLEKKAAMEQKRVLTGEENSNGHDPGIPYIELYLSLIDPPKPKKKGPKRLQHKKKDPAIKLINKLVIPGAFLPKPPPPVYDWRTGKVWKRPGQPEAPDQPLTNGHLADDDEEELSKAEDDEETRLANEKAARMLRNMADLRRLNLVRRTEDEPCCEAHHPDEGDAEQDDECAAGPAHSDHEIVYGRACTYCLGDFSLFMANHVPCQRHRLTHMLNDFLLTSSFQHLIFWT
jgi:hypothetical protein